jgi:hypothetical protein
MLSRPDRRMAASGGFWPALQTAARDRATRITERRPPLFLVVREMRRLSKHGGASRPARAAGEPGASPRRITPVSREESSA